MKIQKDKIMEYSQKIAREAGKILMEYYGKIDKLEYKGVGDVVTKADKESEKFIKERIKSEFPEHSILAEETGMTELDSDYCWAVDPLDGTANYAGRLPIFSVSIALLFRGEPIVGVVFDPNTNRMFCATKDGRATLNDQEIHVNEREAISDITLFGLSTDIINSAAEQVPLLQSIGKGRSLGSAALHLCSVAAGYFDACADIKCKLWDVAAGSLIVEEAGGKFTGFQGKPIFPLSSDSSAYKGDDVPFVASNEQVHEQVLKLL